MVDNIGACGLKCHECDAYVATQANDAARIADVAARWSKEFGGDIKPDFVWCDGCMTAGPRKCGHCAECDIRACVASRGLATCAGCGDYGCDTIQRFWDAVPGAKATLDGLRR